MERLTINDVNYTYKTKYQTVKALDGVSFTFESGKFYAIIGRSGSGKTTLLSLMAGLDVPVDGTVMFGDKDTKEINRDNFRLEHVSVIYQGLNLFPLLTAIENVTFPLEYRGVSKSQAKSVASLKLESVGIDASKHNRLPAMLSGGEQQRVAIARALATNTEVILADEPTGNLDTENSMNIVTMLRNLAVSENVCVIVVTHDTAVAECADVVIKLSDGKIESVINN